jgi:hypothetical protein
VRRKNRKEEQDPPPHRFVHICGKGLYKRNAKGINILDGFCRLDKGHGGSCVK